MTSARRAGAILLGGLLLAAPPCLGQSSDTGGATEKAADKAPDQPAQATAKAADGAAPAPDHAADEALARRRRGLRAAAITLGVLGVAGLVASGVFNGLDGHLTAGMCSYYGMNYAGCVYQFNTAGYITGYAVSGGALVTGIMLGFVSTF